MTLLDGNAGRDGRAATTLSTAAAPGLLPHGAPEVEVGQNAPMGSDDIGRLYPVAKAILTPLFHTAWRLRSEGLEHLPAEGGALICPNHTSVLDSFFVPCVLPRRITYVGKAEYMDDWKTKHLFPALGMIPIDRTGGDASERALNAAQRMLEQGELFGIYPEGTRSRDGRLYRGHTGPARLALRTGTPIIPVGIQGARDVMPADARFPRLRLPVTVRFGPPIDVTRYRDRASDRLVLRQITDEVMYCIRELSGQEYVDEYARKGGASAPAEAAAAAGAEPAGQLATDALVRRPSANGAGDHGSSEVGDPAGEHDRFVEVTRPRSSADVLARPVRRGSVPGG